MSILNNAAMLLLFLIISTATAQTSVFDVTKNGATGDEKTEISQALSSAFKEACDSSNPSKVLIPKGTYVLAPVTLEGPCKAPSIEIEVIGTLKAKTAPSEQPNYSWVSFRKINRFKLSGGGIFDGQGLQTWGKHCAEGSYCSKLPINIRFDFITNGKVQDITSLDSKQFHVNVLGCENLTFQRFNISAPEKSMNTDGIHIGRSTGINITDSHIRTGDDCISIGDGSKQLSINRVTCGPGHGISVGSLGKYDKEEPVVGLTVTNCTFTGTTNGVRIKTWPDSYVGYVSDIHFEDLKMDNVSNPIIIDQVYCPWDKCNKKVASRVKINNVSFKNIKGTSATQVAVKVACSNGVPCEGVKIADIELAYNGKEGPALSECSNVKPELSGIQNPPACAAPTTAA